MIYFLRSGDSNFIKIGYCAGDPITRLKDMQTGNPQQLVLIGCMEGGRFDEKRLHGLFYEYHVRGEWFEHDGFMWDAICRLLEGKIINQRLDTKRKTVQKYRMK